MSVFLKQDRDQNVPELESLGTMTIEPPTEKKEKITSNTKVLLDGTGSDWSDVTEGPSLAITTATIATTSGASITPIRKKINEGLAAKDKLSKAPITSPLSIVDNRQENSEKVSVRESLRSKKAQSEQTDSDSTLIPDDQTDILNEALMLENTLEDFQEDVRKRPKNLLLGKNFIKYSIRSHS